MTEEDRELIMRMAPLYQEQLEKATQQGIEQGVERGLRQGERVVIENLLKVRFGTIDDLLSGIIEPLLGLSAEEFTPLLVNLSKSELLARFGDRPE